MFTQSIIFLLFCRLGHKWHNVRCHIKLTTLLSEDLFLFLMFFLIIMVINTNKMNTKKILIQVQAHALWFNKKQISYTHKKETETHHCWTECIQLVPNNAIKSCPGTPVQISVHCWWILSRRCDEEKLMLAAGAGQIMYLRRAPASVYHSRAVTVDYKALQ